MGSLNILPLFNIFGVLNPDMLDSDIRHQYKGAFRFRQISNKKGGSVEPPYV
jgi:hypothetical protein